MGRSACCAFLGWLVAAGAVHAAANDCDPELPGECSSPSVCAATSEGHFYVGLEDVSYDGTNTTFTYRVCGVPPTQNLSHWVLGLSSQCVAKIVGGNPAGVVTHPDPTTCLSGYKWDTPSGVASCTTTDCGTGSLFQVTFAGDVGLASTTVGNTITTKAGQLVETSCVDGPTVTCASNLVLCTSDAECRDGDACNGQETCVAGACRAGSPLDCDDGVACTMDGCDPATGCTHDGIPDCCGTDADCDDGSVCTGTATCEPATGRCLPGTPLVCNDGDPCNGQEACDSATGCFVETILDCDDGDACTTDGCDLSGCTHDPVPGCCETDADCDDQDACTTDRCVDHACVTEPAPAPPTETACADMQDDDCDGPIDCDDPDCSGVTPCDPIKKDPATIKFGPAGARLDVLKAHGRVEPGTALDVADSEIGWMLSDGHGAIWRGALIPGDFTTNASGTVFRYKDAGARLGNARRFGIYKAKIRIARDGTSYGFKVMAYGDLSAATDPDMSLQFYIGDQNWAHNEPWARTSSGWKASGFE